MYVASQTRINPRDSELLDEPLHARDYTAGMSIEKIIRPAGLVKPVGYAHVVIASDTRRVYIAGQTGVGADGVVVGSDLASQAAKALRNVEIALAAGGATWDDVVRMNLLIVGWEPSMAEGLFAGLGEVFGENWPTASTTMYGVQSLFDPRSLIEIDVIAEI